MVGAAYGNAYAVGGGEPSLADVALVWPGCGWLADKREDDGESETVEEDRRDGGGALFSRAAWRAHRHRALHKSEVAHIPPGPAARSATQTYILAQPPHRIRM